MVLKLEFGSESPDRLVKAQIAGPNSRDSDLLVRDGASEFALLKVFQVMWMLLQLCAPGGNRARTTSVVLTAGHTLDLPEELQMHTNSWAQTTVTESESCVLFCFVLNSLGDSNGRQAQTLFGSSDV